MFVQVPVKVVEVDKISSQDGGLAPFTAMNVAIMSRLNIARGEAWVQAARWGKEWG